MRIRSIKPQFWRSPDVMELNLFQRLLFIGLWNLADDEGRGVYDPASIAADLFLTEFSLSPHGVITDVSNAFVEYSKRSMVAVYEAENRHYFQILQWGKHQRVNRATSSQIPPLTSDNEETKLISEDSLNPHGGLTLGIRNKEEGIRNKEDISSETSSDSSARRPDAYPPAFEEWWKTYPRRKNCSKKDAAKQWREATKTINADELLNLTAIYAKTHGVSDPKYLPHPHKWLKDRRWESTGDSDQQSAPSLYTPEGWRRKVLGTTESAPPVVDAEVLPWQLEA